MERIERPQGPKKREEGVNLGVNKVITGKGADEKLSKRFSIVDRNHIEIEHPANKGEGLRWEEENDSR